MVSRAISSVMRQTYEEWELIIIDDSPDSYEYRNEVDEYIEGIEDDRIHLIRNERNVGACSSRNIAIKMSKGDFIIYLDDDDEFTEDCLEKKLKQFVKPEIGLVYSDCYVLEEETGDIHATKQKKLKGYVFDDLILYNFVYAFPMVRRECFDKCGLFDPDMPALQDYEMWLRIAKQYEFDYVEEPLAIVHLHKDERISTNPGKKIAGMQRLNMLYADYLQHNKYAQHICLIHMVPHYIHAHKSGKAFLIWLHAVMLAPFDARINLQHLYAFIRK